jgi:DNA-binding transcriptional LysR family regulator
VRLAELARAHLRSLEDFRAECRAETVDYTIAAGDSLIQWLVVPRIGALLESTPGVRFATSNLRTNDVVQQLGEGRVDFVVIRKDALVAGLKSADLGTLTYCVVIPKRLAGRTSPFRETTLELKSLQIASGMRSVATSLTEDQVREAEALFRRVAGRPNTETVD